MSRRRSTHSEEELVHRILEGSKKGRETVRKAFQHAKERKERR